MSGNELVEVDGTFLHATDHAVLICDADGVEHWIPKTTIRYDGDFERLPRGKSIKLRVQEWLAHKRGLI